MEEIADVDTILNLLYQKNVTSKMNDSSKHISGNLQVDHENYTNEELKVEVRHRVYTTLKGLYWDFFEEGKCSAQAVLILIESANRGIDHEEHAIDDWQFLQDYFSHNWIYRVLGFCTRIPIIRGMFNAWLYRNLSFSYDVIVNYVEAHQEVIERLDKMLSNQEVMNEVFEEIDKGMALANKYKVDTIEKVFDGVTEMIQ